MKRVRSQLVGAAMLVGAVLFLGLGGATAAPLVCDVVTATECQITTVRPLGAGGSFEVDRTLHIGPTGELRTDPGSALTLAITGGLTIDAGGKITGNVSTANGKGATIAITATGAVVLAGTGAAGAVISADQTAGTCSGGKGGTVTVTSTLYSTDAAITLESRSRISVNARCSAGEIKITATQGGIDIQGVVESVSQLSGTGATQRPGGGPITLSASCNLTINDTGRVSSRGSDPGADLVHLEAGGNVVVIGVVESTGAGHAHPNAPRNHCSGPDRPDKPEQATACVEIWAGKLLVIDGAGTNHGQVNADIKLGGKGTTSWIDLFAKKSITINGSGVGPYASDATSYAVHANQSVSNAGGGIIAIKSLKGHVDLGGQAIQADSVQPGGSGGAVTIEAGGKAAVGGDVDLGAGSVRARGANVGGGPQAGGAISIRSFNGHVVGVAPGEVNANGGGGKPTPAPGVVTLEGCATTPPAVNYSGTSTPAAVIAGPACGGKPTLPAYVAFPSSACDGPPPCVDCPPPCEGPTCPCEGPNCPPPPCQGPECPCQGSDCPPPPCEGADCPCEGANCPPPPCQGADCPCEGSDCPPPPCQGADCPCVGPSCPPPPCQGSGCAPYKHFCEKGTVKIVMDPVSGRFPGNVGPDVVVDVRTGSLQAAIDAASDVNNDGYIIIGVIGQSGGLPGGTGRQEIEIDRAYGKPFALIGCGVTLQDPLPCDSQPVVHVRASATSPEHPVGSGVKVYIQEIAVLASQSAPGWLIEGDGRFLEAIGSQMNMQGVKIVGNGNTIRNSFAATNFAGGIIVNGDGNTVSAVRSTGNATGDGIQVTGHRNTVTDSTAGDQGQGNNGSGIAVNGQSNLIKGNSAFANFGNGITVNGGSASGPNKVKNNIAGALGRGNSMNGIEVGGTGQGASGMLDIVGNTALGNSLAGIRVNGAGHRLKDNTGGANVACQYRVVPNNLNATGNKRGLTPIPGADGSAFPAGCY